MKLIQDLGTRPIGIHNHMMRFGMYECPDCGSITECRSYDVKSGRKTVCTVCSTTVRNTGISMSKARKAKERFAEEASVIHNGKYSYILVDYINNRVKVNIVCPDHGIFEQTPRDHKSGRGCPCCAQHGFDKTKSALLYYLKILSDGVVAYKIGITNLSVIKRFNSTDLSKIIVVKTWDFPLGIDAYNKEQEILKLYKEFKYIGDPLLSTGNTELFTFDILGLDNQIKGCTN